MKKKKKIVNIEVKMIILTHGTLQNITGFKIFPSIIDKLALSTVNSPNLWAVPTSLRSNSDDLCMLQKENNAMLGIRINLQVTSKQH